MSGEPAVRTASAADAGRCAEIYAPYVTSTAISFELEPPTPEEMAERIAGAHAWLVAELAGRVVGYASAGPFKQRPAYQWTCEVSVYLEQGRRRTGAGRALYEELFARLKRQGFRTAVAALALPNEASEGLHAALGFEHVGTLRRVGFKHGEWRDVAWWQRDLGGNRR